MSKCDICAAESPGERKPYPHDLVERVTQLGFVPEMQPELWTITSTTPEDAAQRRLDLSELWRAKVRMFTEGGRGEWVLCADCSLNANAFEIPPEHCSLCGSKVVVCVCTHCGKTKWLFLPFILLGAAAVGGVGVFGAWIADRELGAIIWFLGTMVAVWGIALGAIIALVFVAQLLTAPWYLLTKRSVRASYRQLG